MVKWGFRIGLAMAIVLLSSLIAIVTLAADTVSTPDTLKILVATPSPGGGTVHLVKRGEILRTIARQYGVSLKELAAYNRIADPDRIYVGQALRIPPSAEPTALPSQPTPVVSVPTISPYEEIAILSPGRGVTITNPVAVSGIASSPFEQTIVVKILDGSGGSIGLAAAVISGEYGQRGPFSVTVPFVVPANDQPGRVQVYTESPRDGALEHLNSVTVMLQGVGLDGLLAQLEAAVNNKYYAALESLIGPSFDLSLYRSEAAQLKPAEMRERLQLSYLGPGKPLLDFSVDGRKVLGSQIEIGSDVRHVVYSTGWGPRESDDAFLLIGDVDGRARWIGMVYVPQALIDYPAPRGM